MLSLFIFFSLSFCYRELQLLEALPQKRLIMICMLLKLYTDFIYYKQLLFGVHSFLMLFWKQRIEISVCVCCKDFFQIGEKRGWKNLININDHLNLF